MRKITIIFILLILAGLGGCKKIPTTYASFEGIHIEHWSEVDEHLTPNGLFFVYYYSPHCPDCKSIEADVAKFIYYNQKHYPIVLMKSMSVDEQGIPPIFLRGVPALLIYENGVFKEMLLGPGNVMIYLMSIDQNN